MSYTYRKIKHSDEDVKAYDAFLQRLFGFDLAAWRRQGHWRDNYVPHSLFDGPVVVANLSLCAMDLIVDGRPVTGYQIGAVGVLPAYRGQGLTYSLMERAFQSVPDAQMVYLMSDRALIPFYKKHGFSPVRESNPSLEVPEGIERKKWQAMAPESPVFWRIFAGNRLVSRVFDTHGTEPVYHYHLENGVKNHAKWIEALDAVCLCTQRGCQMTVYDVLSTQKITSEDLLPYFAGAGAKRVDFLFTPDALGGPFCWEPEKENVLFFRNRPPFGDTGLKYPIMGRT